MTAASEKPAHHSSEPTAVVGEDDVARRQRATRQDLVSFHHQGERIGVTATIGVRAAGLPPERRFELGRLVGRRKAEDVSRFSA